MGRVRQRRTLLAIVAATTMTVALGLPVAADLNLIIGDSAQVSYTNGDGVNVRVDPGYGSGILATLFEGTAVTIQDGPLTLDDGTSWYFVSADTTDGGIEGWVIADYLSSEAGEPVAPTDSSSGPGPVSMDTAFAAVVANTEGNGLNLRDGPSFDAAVITVMPEGGSVQVVASEIYDEGGNAWSQVNYEGIGGYAASAYLASDAAAPAPDTTQPEQPVETEEQTAGGLAVGARAAVSGTGGGGLNLRYEAGYSAGILTVIPEGEIVAIVDGPLYDDEGSAWFQVDYAGAVGWVHGGYLVATETAPTASPPVDTTEATPVAEPPAESTPEPAPEEPVVPDEPSAAVSGVGASIVAEALNYVGLPYVWGGTTPSGFDCSGFTYFILNRVGIGVSRDMAEQMANGVPVSSNALEPGDLVFFQNTYKWGLSHVGIYIGGGQMVNAQSERTGVAIANIWDSYWGPRFYAARRLYS